MQRRSPIGGALFSASLTVLNRGNRRDVEGAGYSSTDVPKRSLSARASSMRQRSLILLAAFISLGSVATFAAETGGATYQDWLKRREALSKDASVLRYYTFE